VTKKPSSRPGGRSSRVRAAVFDAVEALMAKNPREIPSMAEIAERAGVNPTSLYRRWGDASVLATEVAIERLMRDAPIPDTGTLRGDLLKWALNAARGLSGRKTVPLLRIVASTVQTGEKQPRERLAALARRGQEIVTMLERAEARGELAPTLGDVLDVVIAPIYYRILFFGPITDKDDVVRFVDRLLALTASEKKARR